MYKLKIIFYFFLFSLITTDVNSQGRSDTYQRMTNVSSKIVQGKITASEPILYEFKGQTLTCGWILDIDVVRSWKGGDESFKVFATNRDILLGFDYDYMIFARRNPNYNMTKQNVQFVNCSGLNSTRMDVSKFPFFATSLKQQIFPLVKYTSSDNIIDEDTNTLKSGDWMLIANRLSNAYLPETINRRRLDIGNENIIEEMSLDDFLSEFILYR